MDDFITINKGEAFTRFIASIFLYDKRLNITVLYVNNGKLQSTNDKLVAEKTNLINKIAEFEAKSIEIKVENMKLRQVRENYKAKIIKQL